MKGSHQVLAVCQIDAGLATDSRVHLCDQCRGNLHNRDPAHKHRREKTTYITDYSSTQSEDDGMAISAGFHQFLGKLLQVRKTFGAFAVWHFEELHLA